MLVASRGGQSTARSIEIMSNAEKLRFHHSDIGRTGGDLSSHCHPELAQELRMICIENPSPTRSFPTCVIGQPATLAMPDIFNRASINTRHARRVLSGIHFGFVSDGSPLTTCGDATAENVASTEQAWPDKRSSDFHTFMKR